VIKLNDLQITNIVDKWTYQYWCVSVLHCAIKFFVMV